MAIIKVGDLDDRVQDWVRMQGRALSASDLVDEDMVLEKLEERDPLLFDKIKNPQKYSVSRWKILDIE